jgi:diguanylate cyclase (GGDEF)-like protein
MKRHSISFRQLLERVLPLEALPPADLARVRVALAHGSTAEQEEAALVALERLAALGVLDRLPDRLEAGERIVRFQRRDAHEVVALRFPMPAVPPGVDAVPRALATLAAAAPAERVRRLSALDATLIRADDRLPSGASELIGLLLVAARDILDCDSAAFFPPAEVEAEVGAYTPPAGEESLLGAWTRATVLEHDRILTCDDAPAVPALRPAAERLGGVRSVAAVRVRAEQSGLTGVLEVRSRQPRFFRAGRLSMLALLAETFSARANQAARLAKLVFVDGLTGAYNNAYFRQALANECARARRENHSMALVLGDIDDFKRFNTLYGYEGGNAALKQVARILKRQVRPFDTVARWGGEEFAVLLTAPVDRADAAMIAERLRHAIAATEHAVTGLDGVEHRVAITISIGAALFPDDAASAEDLWRIANQALLEAKQPPKNRVVFWTAKAPGGA